MKLFIQSEDILFENNKWICDTFKEEFIQYANININTTNNIDNSDIIWILAPWIF